MVKSNIIDNNRENGDCRKEDKSSESNNTKEFDAILKYIKNNGKNTKSINYKSHGNNIDLHNFIIKLVNEEKILKTDYGFDEPLNIFDEIDNK